MQYREIPPHFQWLIPIFSGIVIGLVILLPAYELVAYFDNGVDPEQIRLGTYIRQNWFEALTLKQPFKAIFYIILGGSMGSIIARMSRRTIERQLKILQLQAELDGDLDALIAQGESEMLEFKSSYRYDLRQEKINKGLEQVIMKTLAGMMNSEGGTLLIGVDDEGKILGLQPDYQTLKRKDHDGFEQLLNSTVADRLGTPACEWMQVFFHDQDGNEVCRIRVVPAPQPVYLKEGKDSKFYLRTGAGTRAMTLQEAVSFIQRKWGK